MTKIDHDKLRRRIIGERSFSEKIPREPLPGASFLKSRGKWFVKIRDVKVTKGDTMIVDKKNGDRVRVRLISCTKESDRGSLWTFIMQGKEGEHKFNF